MSRFPYLLQAYKVAYGESNGTPLLKDFLKKIFVFNSGAKNYVIGITAFNCWKILFGDFLKNHL